MDTFAMSQIEKDVSRLSLDEQLWLLECLARQLRENLMGQDSLGAQLAAMAADPEIQNELRKIELEFVVTEEDGLGEV